MQHTVGSILQTLCTKALTPALGILAAARPWRSMMEISGKTCNDTHKISIKCHENQD